LQRGKKAVDFLFSENGNQGTQRHSQYPVPDYLFYLDREIIPEIHGFTMKDFCHCYIFPYPPLLPRQPVDQIL